MQTSKEPLNCRVVYVELCFPFVKGKVLKVQPNLPATVPFRVGEKKILYLSRCWTDVRCRCCGVERHGYVFRHVPSIRAFALRLIS